VAAESDRGADGPAAAGEDADVGGAADAGVAGADAGGGVTGSAGACWARATAAADNSIRQSGAAFFIFLSCGKAQGRGMNRVILAAFVLCITANAPANATSLELPARNGRLHLIVVGDAGATHSRLRAGILAVQKAHGLDAIILAGDNFYPCGIRSLADPQWAKITEHFGPANVPIYAVFGNHDYGDAPHEKVPPQLCAAFGTNPGAELAANGKVPHWNFPAENYVVHSSVADFVMLDTQPVAMDWSTPYLGSGTSAQVTKFLQDSLSASSGPWRIVVGHHTLYSSGMHGRTNGFDQRHMRAALLPLLRAEKTDLYICGHDHDLELLGNLHHAGDPLFLVSGAGSGLDEMKARKPAALAIEPPTLWPPRVAAAYGFALLEIDRDELAITFYDAAGTAISERFSMKKGRSGH
jgi:tartrate-resistant acid phosphatase type 5